MTYADVVEDIRALLATYAHALDDGRTDDVVATFCDDGTVDLGRMGTFTGHDALRDAYAGWVPQLPQRHLVVNTLVSGWSDEAATAVSDVVFLQRGDAGWGIGLVARYQDELHRHDGAWRFHRRVMA